MPFVLFADYECVLVPPNNTVPPPSDTNVQSDTTQQDSEELNLEHEEPDIHYMSDSDYSKTSGVVSEHQIGSFALSCQAPQQFQHLFPPQVYTGPYAAHRFIEALMKFRKTIRELHENEFKKEMIPLTPTEKLHHDQVDVCHICKEKITCQLTLDEYIDTMGAKVFTDNQNDTSDKLLASETDMLGPKVMDHSHQNGLYRGPAHSHCNIQYREQRRKTPCYFHAGKLNLLL